VGPPDGKAFEGDLIVAADWCDPPIAACSGAYILKSTTVHGQRVWEKMDGGYVLFSTEQGCWCITRNDIKAPFKGVGMLVSDIHAGVGPEHVTGWKSQGGAEVDIIVRTDRIIEGYPMFYVGERVRSAENITCTRYPENVHVRAGQAGWIKGRRPDGLLVRFDSMDRDIVAVAQEIDHVTGPTRMVRRDGAFMRCTEVNSVGSHIKVHFHGLGDTEWISRESDRIQNASMMGAEVKLSESAVSSHGGCLAGGKVGRVISEDADGKLGQIKVRVKEGESSWYDASVLVIVSPAPSDL